MPVAPDFYIGEMVRGREITNFIDCWKAGHFALEAKATDVADGNEAPLRKAYGQVHNYAAHAKGASPPYLMVVDVPRTLIVWDRWSGEYGGFPAAHRINLATLHERPDDIRLLQDIFTNLRRAGSPRAGAGVTKEIAGELAELSAALRVAGMSRSASRASTCAASSASSQRMSASSRGGSSSAPTRRAHGLGP